MMPSPLALAFPEEAAQPEYVTPCAHTMAAGGVILEGTYGVYFGKQLSGKVHVTRQGLYYHFCCRCQISEEVVCRLRVTCNDHQENLGIVVPTQDGFGLDTKVPVKRLGQGIPSFSLVPKSAESEGIFVPIYPEEPFSYMERLKDAFLARKYGQIGVIIK